MGGPPGVVRVRSRSSAVRSALNSVRLPSAVRSAAAAADWAVSAAVQALQGAVAALAVADAEHDEAQRRVKAAEAALAAAREDRVRAEAASQHAVHARLSLLARIRERVEAAPEDLPALAGLEDGPATADPAEVERRLERLLRERESIGPVNLMAEQEAGEVDGRIQVLVTERADLTGAIQRAPGATPIWLLPPSVPTSVPMVWVPWPLPSTGTALAPVGSNQL